jgi:hypothetical protein
LVYGIFKVSSAGCQEPRGIQEGYSKQNIMETKTTLQEIISEHETARFNIVSLRHNKKDCDKGKRGKEGISAWHIIQTPFPRRKHFRLCRRIA